MGLNVGNIILIGAGRSVQVTYALFMVGIIFLRSYQDGKNFIDKLRISYLPKMISLLIELKNTIKVLSTFISKWFKFL